MPGLQDIAERISRSYDTRVMVSLGKRKGKIVVEFGSVEDLQRIVALMDPQSAK
jgi:ParB family chromosome partitioning protein